MSVTITNQRRPRPGFEPRRLADLCTAAVDRCHLDLAGRTVITEAATGAYATTPVLAAVAGGTVRIVAADSAYGSRADAVDEVLSLARLLGVSERVSLVDRYARDVFRDADVVTNSGHLRPIDAHAVAQLRPGSAVSLMYEAWELREEDVDIDACSAQGVYVAGINEQHPAVDVFSFLGLMAVKQLLDAGVAPYHSSVLLVCDNSFAPYLERTLASCGARVTMVSRFDLRPNERFDVVLVACRPSATDVLTERHAERLGGDSAPAVVVQFWGDVDRESLRRADVRVWPEQAPGRGHMGILPSAVGPEPIVRLQSGGLKVGEILTAGRPPTAAEELYLQRVVTP